MTLILRSWREQDEVLGAVAGVVVTVAVVMVVGVEDGEDKELWI